MSSVALQPELGSVVYRRPRPSEGKDIHCLISDCSPLDLNSSYAYMLLCVHFADTCVVAEEGGRVVGFLSAYRKPADPDVVFVWQVAVSPTVRGRGIGSRMLAELTVRPSCSSATAIETTIGPSNRVSWALFESFAKKLGAAMSRETLFLEEDFGDEGHEAEVLLRVGPIDPEKRASYANF
jgi:L-2,4-diaminobutyric acid acetyltransferase